MCVGRQIADAVGSTTSFDEKGTRSDPLLWLRSCSFRLYGRVARGHRRSRVCDRDFRRRPLGCDVGFLFCSRSRGQGGIYVINGVRAQFRENPGILRYGQTRLRRCVGVVTVGALKEMVLVQSRWNADCPQFNFPSSMWWEAVAACRRDYHQHHMALPQ
jgi:hypothetical protein